MIYKSHIHTHTHNKNETGTVSYSYSKCKRSRRFIENESSFQHCLCFKIHWRNFVLFLVYQSQYSYSSYYALYQFGGWYYNQHHYIVVVDIVLRPFLTRSCSLSYARTRFDRSSNILYVMETTT